MMCCHMIGSFSSDLLIEKVCLQWRIPSLGQVVFSSSCPHYIAPTEGISSDQFVELLNKSGGSKGHAKLYLLPIKVVQQNSEVQPDLFCMAQLSEFIRLLILFVVFHSVYHIFITVS